MTDTPAALAAFAERLADAARAVTLEHFRQRVAIETKADASPVTIADRDAEAAMRALIAATYPDDGIFGEEHGRAAGRSGRLWTLDPIDGTQAFVTGMPLWGTLIACWQDQRPVAGVLESSAMNDRWIGAAGAPTLLNAAPCRTSGCTDLAKASVFATTPDLFIGDEIAAFDRVSKAAARRRFGGDCYAYGMVAAGHVDLVVEARLHPYDFAPFVPIIEGAGGVITDWQGAALTLDSPGQVVAAATPALHAQALELLNA